MNPQEKKELMELIALIRQKFGVGLWLIEHDMKLVMSICERLTVLDHGEPSLSGRPGRSSLIRRSSTRIWEKTEQNA